MMTVIALTLGAVASLALVGLARRYPPQREGRVYGVGLVIAALIYVVFAAGLCGAAAASSALVSLLFGVSRLDPAAYLGVVSWLAAVSAAACWVPAWRASRVDPSVTLRAE